MHKTALVLSCLASTYHAKRVLTPKKDARPSEVQADAQISSENNPSQALAKLIAASNTDHAFQVLGSVAGHTKAPRGAAANMFFSNIIEKINPVQGYWDPSLKQFVTNPETPYATNDNENSKQKEATASGKIGVLLLNLGGPDNLDDVEPFLYNLFFDPEIITLPRFLAWLNGPLATVISKSRAPQSRAAYESIGGGSPQLKTTEAQGRALEEALALRGVEAKTYVAMRYWNPLTEDALEAVKADGVERLVVLPLYPQFSISTTGSSLRLLEKVYYSDPDLQRVRNIVIPAWYKRPGYIDALSGLIEKKCAAFDDASRPHIFFSAHGLPKKYIETLGDPYQEQTEQTVKYVMEKLKLKGFTNDHTLAFQSRVGPVEWLRPYTDDKIRELAANGVRDLVVVPVSFVSEHIETLEEIDGEYAELAKEVGITGWQRVPALGLDQAFIDDLAGAVIEALPGTDKIRPSEIDEGQPVSLGIVNDLVQLRGKDALVQSGRFRINSARTGFTPNAELVNGRIAMFSVTVASLVSLYRGSFIGELLDGRLPF